MPSLVGEITEPPTEYLKDLSDAEEDGDDGEGVHGAEEDGLLKVFGHHALGHVEGLFQSAGVTHVQRVDLVERDTSRGDVRAQRGSPKVSQHLDGGSEGSSRLLPPEKLYQPGSQRGGSAARRQ